MSTRDPRHTAGSRGGEAETWAERYLAARGLRPVTRNYRCKLGEIDLVMRDGDQLVFVEVRLRSGSGFGTPAETVTRNKQQKIIRTAAYFLQSKGLTEQASCRFDVVSIEGDISRTDRDESNTHWLRDAFSAYN